MTSTAHWLARATLAGAALAGTLLGLSAVSAQDSGKPGEQPRAAESGGLAAIGIGIAVLPPAQHGDAHRHDTQWDAALYGNPFSPAANVVCLPGQRQCLARGAFSYSWTKRVFGTSAAFEDNGAGWDGGYGDFGTFGVDLERAREVCLAQSSSERLKNVTIDEAKQMTDEWAYVYMRARPNPRLPDYQRWRCAYSFQTGKTDFKRM